MTKAQIDAVIALITTGGLNTATEAVNAWNALEGELFPTPVKVEWNGTSSVSPTTDIVVFPTLITGKVKFTIRFWKSGNNVDFNGEFEAYDYLGAPINNIQLIEWNTSLFEPLSTSKLVVPLECIDSVNPITASYKIKIDDTGLYLFGSALPSIAKFRFHGNYKVAN